MRSFLYSAFQNVLYIVIPKKFGPVQNINLFTNPIKIYRSTCQILPVDKKIVSVFPKLTV